MMKEIQKNAICVECVGGKKVIFRDDVLNTYVDEFVDRYEECLLAYGLITYEED